MFKCDSMMIISLRVVNLIIFILWLIVELVVSLDSTQNYREPKTHRLTLLWSILQILKRQEITLLQCFHTQIWYNLLVTQLLNTVEAQQWYLEWVEKTSKLKVKPQMLLLLLMVVTKMPCKLVSLALLAFQLKSMLLSWDHIHSVLPVMTTKELMEDGPWTHMFSIIPISKRCLLDMRASIWRQRLT